MNENKVYLPDIFYALFLKKIQGVNFTLREIDIISCLLSGRTLKKISYFLNISPKTVESHVWNIRKKLNCHSRQSIIDFIEKSEEYIPIKIYYSNLLIYKAFEKILNSFSKKSNEGTMVLIHCLDLQKDELQIVHQIKDHLGLAKIQTVLIGGKRSQRLDKDNPLTILWAFSPKTIGTQDLLLAFENPEERESALNHAVGFNGLYNYYFSFFDLLKKLFPYQDFNIYFSEFQTLCNKNNYHLDPNPKQPKDNSKLKETVRNWYGQLFLAKAILKRKKKLLWSAGISILFLSSTNYLFLDGRGEGENKPFFLGNKTSHICLVRSNLIIPQESVLLQRPELISLIDDKFKEGDGIQTVALVGMGGSGKTTLARQYARRLGANVSWEINAETEEHLKEEFENLAQALSKTEEDKELFQTIKEIKNSIEKEKKIILFVSKLLKTHRKWLLIYDNVERFTDIQKYFPHDHAIWGKGKIIITTRDNHIRSNTQINHTIQIGELNQKQKQNLFAKIMSHDNEARITPAQQEKVVQFLDKIPPFPLDISIAAYYLKATNISHEQYLEHLSNYNNDFSVIQQNVLKDASDYSKTRYLIITLAVEELLRSYKDFGDLLLLISLLDSQNIPKDLLDTYKNNIIVDNFIYHLKKYSLITNDLYPSSLKVSSYSIHRSTQEIILNHLVKKIDIKSGNKTFQRVANAFIKYLVDTIDQEDLPKMKVLLSHGEKLLAHNYLLTDDIIGSICRELGYINQYIGDYEKARILLSKSLTYFHKSSSKNHAEIARALVYLGKLSWVLGDYEKAKNILEECIVICKTHLSEEHVAIARAFEALSLVYRYSGDNEKAKNLLEQCLIILKKHFSENDVRLGSTLGNLGIVYMNLGDYEKAKNLLEKSYFAYKQYSEKHIGVGWALAYLGNVYGFLGDYDKAKNLLNQSLIQYKKDLSKNHVGIARNLNYLGIVFMRSGNYKKAKNLLEQSLTIYRKNFSENHSDVAKVLMYLGEVSLLEGNIENAENLLNKSSTILQQNKHLESYLPLEILTELYCKKHLQSMKLGKLLESQIFKKKAIEHLTQALEIVKTNFPQDSPHYVRIQAKLKNLN